MKKIFLPNKKNGARRKIFLPTLVVAIVFATTVFVPVVRKGISGIVVSIVVPAKKISISTNEFFKSYLSFLKSKSALEKKIALLEEENNQMSAQLILLEALKKENEELKNVFNRKNDDRGILAGVLLRPPEMPYDTLLLDAGSRNGVIEGMNVIVGGDIILGRISEVFANSSKARMISFPGETTAILAREANFAAMAEGIGGGMLKITMPNAAAIKYGDAIITPGIFPLTIGFVEKIEIDLSNPFQTVFFRLPLNINELKNVIIKENHHEESNM